MRSAYLVMLTASSALTLACGPARPGNLEGFGDTVGDTEVGSEDTDTDTETGDEECVVAYFGADESVHWLEFIDASAGDDFEDVCGQLDGADKALRWVAPSSGPYRARLFSEFGSSLLMLRGDDCEAPLEACGDQGVDTNLLVFEAEAGQSYVFVADANSAEDTVEFFLEPIMVSDGECPDASIDALPHQGFGDTQGGSFQFDSSCGGESAPERTFLFVPPFTGPYVFSTAGSDFDTVLYLLDGSCGGAVIDCNDDFDDVTSLLFVDLVAGQPTTIVVDGFGNATGNYGLEVIYDGDGPPPPTPICEDATALPSVVPVVLSWSAVEPTESTIEVCNGFPFERRFTWVAPEDGFYDFSFDTAGNPGGVTVFPQGCGSPWLCGDGVTPGVVSFVAGGEEVVFAAEWSPEQPGATAIRIDPAEGGMPGCGMELEGLSVAVEGSTAAAGDDSAGSCVGVPGPEQEFWWVVPATGIYAFSLTGNFDTVLYVRDGGCEGPELSCDDDGGGGTNSSLVLDLIIGQTISIFVDGFDDAGAFELSIVELP